MQSKPLVWHCTYLPSYCIQKGAVISHRVWFHLFLGQCFFASNFFCLAQSSFHTGSILSCFYVCMYNCTVEGRSKRAQGERASFQTLQNNIQLIDNSDAVVDGSTFSPVLFTCKKMVSPFSRQLIFLQLYHGSTCFL